VRTNPKPQNTCFNFHTQRPISLSGPYRPIFTNLLKMQRIENMDKTMKMDVIQKRNLAMTLLGGDISWLRDDVDV